MAVGRVKSFNSAKGFGFIETPGVKDDVFVHFSSIIMTGFKTLEINTAVEFDLVPTPRGYMADRVRIHDPQVSIQNSAPDRKEE